MPQIEHGDLADHRIRAAQCLHRGQRSGVRRAEHDELRDAFAGRMRERGARHEPAHAVADERDVVAAVGRDALGEQLAERGDVAPPVVVEQHGVEAGLAQGQRQLEVAVVHRAERARRATSSLSASSVRRAERDVDGIEPEDVVGPLAAANEAELRAHDAGQHVHAAPRRGAFCACAWWRAPAPRARRAAPRRNIRPDPRSVCATPACRDERTPRRAPAGRTGVM